MVNRPGGGHRIKIIVFFIVLFHLCITSPALAEENLLYGLLPSSYIITSPSTISDIPNATDGNTSTYICLGRINDGGYVEYTLPSSFTITGLQVYSNSDGILEIRDDLNNTVFYSEINSSNQFFQISANNVRYIKVQSDKPLSSAKFYLYEIYLYGYIPTLPETPTDLNATALSYNQVQLSWNANTEPDLAGYIIYRDYVEIARVGSESTSYIDSGLQPNTQYTYGIKAYNTVDLMSDMSNAATVTTLLPPAPTGLTVNDVTPTGANVTWNAVADASSYNIYLDGSPVYNTTQTQYGITGLSPGTNHTVEVRTVISGVESSAGASTASFTTVPPPAIPTGLSLISVTYNEVQLSWNANTEPDLAGYIIYRNYVEIARVGSESTSFTDSGLKPNTNYSYGIEAYNFFDLFSGMSNIVTVKTLLIPSSLKTPSPSVMANDISASTSMVMYPFGGLLALALGIKLCPWVITIVKSVFLK